jgi:hypothetical protein
MGQSRRSIQSRVRRRDRFLCAQCRRKVGERYAHIIPDTSGGAYDLSNLNLLCASCDTQLEAARSGGEREQQLIGVMAAIRDQPKGDGLWKDLFLFPAGKKTTILLGGGFKFVNQARVLESVEHPDKPYVSLSVNELGMLVINAYFEDESGRAFMEIIDNSVTFHTKHAWDFVMQRHSIQFEHVNRDISLRIRQSKNCDLHVTGNLYINGGLYRITNDEISGANEILRNNMKVFVGDDLGRAPGLLLQPGKVSF